MARLVRVPVNRVRLSRITREMTAVARSPEKLEALSDEDLLVRVARGGEAAITVLFDRHGGSMYGLAARIIGDDALAQDAVQDAFLGIWRNASRFDGARASARSWMLAIARHRAIDAVRRRRPTSKLPADDAPPAALVLPDVWGDVRRRLDGVVVGQALQRLAPVQREAIELAYFGGLTQQEIADRTGAPLGTVKSRVRLGLLALRTEIEALERPSPMTGASGVEAREERR